VLLATPLAPLHAQQDTAPRRNAVTVQPLHAVFGAWSGEYERVLGRATSLALGVSVLDGELGDFWDGSGDDDRMHSAELKLRLYPDGRVLRGLSIGLMAGMVRERETFYDAPDASSPPPQSYVLRREWESLPAYGFLFEHGWFDKSGRGLLVMGLGGKRVLRSGERSDHAYLTARISVGVAF
jgi:hypothetical protein